jgi:hypothetical protein
MRIMVASLLGAACLVAAPASTAVSLPPLPLTITCVPAAGCTVVGQLGGLVATLTPTPQGEEVIICVANASGPCSAADAVLFVAPNVILGNLGIGNGFATVIITAQEVLAIAGNGPYGVRFLATNGAVGLVWLSPGGERCLSISGLHISAPIC